MKYYYFTLISALLLFSVGLKSQCDTVVPATAVVYSTITTHTTNNADIWLCDGVDLTVTGRLNTIYAEGNNDIIIDNSSNVVFAKGPGTLTLNDGFTEVSHESNVTVTDNGNPNVIQQCASVVFDYTNAPTSGCDIYAGIDKGSIDHKVTLFPNPAINEINLNLPKGMVIESVSIYAMNGQLLQKKALLNGSKSIDVHELPDGIYMLQLNNWLEDGMMRFVKN
ncbi:MAG: T9SS type A sorting domain-containing protein [Vicingaceae bacterium]